MTPTRPLIVVVDRDEFDSARRALEADGWFCQSGFVPCSAEWDVSHQRIVCCGELGAEQDAMAAALAAARGAGLVVLDGSVPELTERLVEDLTRLGQVELGHLVPAGPARWAARGSVRPARGARPGPLARRSRSATAHLAPHGRPSARRRTGRARRAHDRGGTPARPLSSNEPLTAATAQRLRCFL